MLKSISPKDLKQRMDSSQGVVLLDVRPLQAYEEWRIQGHRVQSINVQNSKLKEFGIESFPEIPKDKEIVTVCARGNSARETTNLLLQNGYQAVLLEGGMAAWSEFYEFVSVMQSNSLSIYQVLRPAKGCLSYMIVSGDEAVVVDAGRHIQNYIDFASALHVSIRQVMDTHLHADHISGGRELAIATGATYRIAPAEMEGTNLDFESLQDKYRIPFGQSEVEMVSLYTPGHTVASTSFLIDGKYLLSGDTVFVNGLGRPDLKGRANDMAKLLYETVFTRLNNLPDETIILPGHYSDYREVNEQGFVGEFLGNIRNNNPLLRMFDQAEFIETVVGRAGATPPNHQFIININRGVQVATPEEQGGLEIGPNRCAVKH